MGLILLLAAAIAINSEAVCDLFAMVPCVPAAKNLNVKPDMFCCANIKTIMSNPNGPECLCSLMNEPLAVASGVVPRIAVGLPLKCGVDVPSGLMCDGNF